MPFKINPHRSPLITHGFLNSKKASTCEVPFSLFLFLGSIYNLHRFLSAVFGDSLKPISRREAGVEPTGTKPQERVLHSEAARRGKNKDVFYKSSRRGDERNTKFSAGQAVECFYLYFYLFSSLKLPKS